jgi:endonuclease YncB( thermonuclease family)
MASEMPKVSFTRRAVVRSVIDGDTVAVDVDLGFLVMARMSCRIAGIDAPEHNTLEGKAARAFLTKLLMPGAELIVDSIKVDKYGGRFDATVWTRANGTNIGDLMINAGQAKAWAVGKEPKPYALP